MKKLLKVLLVIIIVIGVIVAVCAVANKINEANLIEYIDTFDKVAYDEQLKPELDTEGVPYFTTDGEFRIMHLTDVHITGGFLNNGKDKKAMNAVAAMISEEKPDLVVVTGDISFPVPWTGTLNNAYAHTLFARLMERLGTYWTVSFGNHDSEGYNFYDRAAVADMYEREELEYCLFSSGSDELYGECNHVINVKNSKNIITKSLIMMDTNAYTEDDPFGILWHYDWIHEDQIEWYRSQVEKYTAANRATYLAMDEAERPEGYESEVVKSLLFIHIPLREVKYAYDEYVAAGRADTEDVKFISGIDGETGDVVFPGGRDEEMFETMLALGSTEAMFYGHDHLNNFVLEYKGIKLVYGHSIDYSAYAGIDQVGAQRGIVMIGCGADGKLTVTHENYYQDKYQPLYEKENVKME